MTANQLKKEIIGKLGYGSDQVRVRKGKVEILRSYFYRHGKTVESFADEINSLLGLTDAGHKVTHEDRWAQWPKTSYFVVIVEPKI